jgi:hypothetical protein
MNEQKIFYAMTWFQPEEWQKLKDAVDDPSSLDDSYEEWKIGAEESIRNFRKNGQHVQKFSIKVSRLLEWCKENGRKPDGKARSEYVTFLARERSRGK